MIATAPQTQAPAPVVRGRPLISISGAASLCERSTSATMDLIEEGFLLWTWDFAVGFGVSHRRFFRILKPCIDEFLSSRQCLLEFQDVVEMLFPQGIASLDAVEVSRVLNVDTDTLYNLARTGAVDFGPCKKGPGGSPKVKPESLVNLLKRRRYPLPVSD